MRALSLVKRAPEHAPILKIGDRVTLASGGPTMLVVDLNGDDITCGWSDGEITVPAICLRK